MNNQQMQGQHREPTIQDIALNNLIMRIAQLEGNLAIANAENEILRKELDKLREGSEEAPSEK